MLGARPHLTKAAVVQVRHIEGQHPAANGNIWTHTLSFAEVAPPDAWPVWPVVGGSEF